jgi:hypothetical protein
VTQAVFGAKGDEKDTKNITRQNTLPVSLIWYRLQIQEREISWDMQCDSTETINAYKRRQFTSCEKTHEILIIRLADNGVSTIKVNVH